MRFRDITAEEAKRIESGRLLLALRDDDADYTIWVSRKSYEAAPGEVEVSIHRAKGPNPIPFWWAAETEDQGLRLASNLKKRTARFVGDADQEKLIPEALRKLSRTGRPVPAELLG